MEDLDSLRDGLVEGRLDRRLFVQKALALGISLPAAGVPPSWNMDLTCMTSMLVMNTHTHSALASASATAK